MTKTKQSEWLSRLTRIETYIKNGEFIKALQSIERIKKYEREHRVRSCKDTHSL